MMKKRKENFNNKLTKYVKSEKSQKTKDKRKNNNDKKKNQNI